MKGWEIFEINCYNYLVNEYGQFCEFEAFGKSDSTNPDILVKLPNKDNFFIETKEPNAQCGQFVLHPNEIEQEFIYSQKNKTKINKYSQEIINYMNNNFEDFLNAGTAGVDINVDSNICYNWIKTYYSLKNVKFFITKGSNYIIFPIEKFHEYFSVSGKYRVKKSGSNPPSKNNISEIKKLFAEKNISINLYKDGKKYYVNTPININKLELKGQKYTYLFKKVDNNDYIISRLSNTYNANVIFSISLKTQQNIDDLNNFKNYIN